MSPFGHLPKLPDGFELQGNHLCIAQQSISEIAEHVGRTPFFLYSKSAIETRLSEIRRSIPDEVLLHYAVKANPFSELLGFVADRVDGLDIASAGELELALNSGVTPAHIGFAGPGKTMDELRAAVRTGITVQLESQTELDRVVDLARHFDVRPNVALRINPDFNLRGSGLKMSGSSTPFGIDVDLAPGILTSLRSLPVEFAGFHIFTGSQCLDTEAICESQRRCVALAKQLTQYAPNPPKMLNIGGGFGIPYFPGDTPIDLDRIGANLHDLVRRMRADFSQAHLILELGRYVVGESGVYVCRVVDKKMSGGKTFLITDGGMHHHLAASGNLGSVLKRNYPVVIANRIGNKQTEVATVVGHLCSPLDVLARDIELSRADIGDYVGVFQSGAYGLTASPIMFLSHPAPPELLL